MKSSILLTAVSLIILLSSCAFVSVAPPTFIRTSDPGWTSMQFRDGITDDAAWQGVMDVIARRFEIEVLSKESGYLRTTWNYEWATDRVVEYYRTRVTVKMNFIQKKLDLKTEANYYGRPKRGIGVGKPQWIHGTDTRLLQTMKTDLGGLISSVTN